MGLSKEFIHFCSNEGIQRQLIQTCTSQQNGIIEW
jgi:hypothetical protein